MTDSNGVMPSNEELHEIMRLAGRKICDLSIIQIGRLNTLSAMYFGYLARAELQRRQQPAVEAAIGKTMAEPKSKCQHCGKPIASAKSAFCSLECADADNEYNNADL